MSTIPVETVVPVMTCGRCGAATSHGQRFCTDCGTLLGRTATSADFDPLRGVTRAGIGPVALARVIDVLVVLLGAAVGAALLAAAHVAVPTSDLVGSAVAGAVIGLVATSATVAGRASRTGRGPGGLLVGTRVVDTDDGLSCGPLRQVTRLVRGRRSRRPGGAWARASGTVTAALRTGRDPLAPAVAPLGVSYGTAASAGIRPGGGTRPGGPAPVGLDATRLADGDVASVPHGSPLDGSVPADASVLTFDSGSVHWFRGTCVIGRNPEAEPSVTTVAVPDLSRTLSKTHVALVRADALVLARDLGSTNGSSLVHPDGSVEPMAPDVDVAVPVGGTIRIGDHAFRLDRIGGVA